MKGIGKQARETIVKHYMEYSRRERQYRDELKAAFNLPDTDQLKQNLIHIAKRNRNEATSQKRAMSDLMITLNIRHPAQPDVDEYIRQSNESG